ncbi:D-ribulose kinase [Chloropicon primus]|uniref:Carbohydrate kinase n=1 Tax=Chloropicon primus TaxID=1764295 RepID=A0A5B8MGI6_9CHLO|nr:hypothetical protein A3770_03p20610 [Chloropicon primus]UPQ98755.1 D-ribulose kinase [Chloropicon primus]|eukprot:QDZ19543.1 hypothetical protein A3770_03p20610 [Chloropicon primus]
MASRVEASRGLGSGDPGGRGTSPSGSVGSTARRWSPGTRAGGGSRTAAGRGTYLGLDFGTSGARAIVIDDSEEVLHSEKVDYAASGLDQEEAARSTSVWEGALFSLLGNIPSGLASSLRAICIDGTSSTSFLVDRETWSIESRPLLYNFAAEASVVERVKAIAPEGNITCSPTSTLSKLFTWLYEDSLDVEAGNLLLLHQADWLSSLLLQNPDRRGVSDYNNALKLGYDPQEKDYPQWMKSQAWRSVLPAAVVAPSTPLGVVSDKISDTFRIPRECKVAAGTTDSIAAFLAAGASEPGEAVTSLGSTLAIKVLSTKRVDNLEHGIYSHKLWGDLWLAGGASNTGGAVIRKYFPDDQVEELTKSMDTSAPTGLAYYPLLKAGERFPVSDAKLEPKLNPRPSEDSVFLQGILEGIADIEKRGFELLHKEGCSTLTRVMTCGGGSKNDKWTEMRRQRLKVPVETAAEVEAAFGSARLARRSD